MLVNYYYRRIRSLRKHLGKLLLEIKKPARSGFPKIFRRSHAGYHPRVTRTLSALRTYARHAIADIAAARLHAKTSLLQRLRAAMSHR